MSHADDETATETATETETETETDTEDVTDANAAAEQVRESNEAFYQAFRDRDLAEMGQLWAMDHEVTCIHPGMRALVGRSAVMQSWRGIFLHRGSPRVVCTEVQVQVYGDFAWVTCLEGLSGQAGTLVATNAFVREHHTWRLVHHQAGPLSRGVRTTRTGEEFDPTMLN